MNCANPIAFDELIAYHQGELDDERQSMLEEHYFSCESCSARLETLAQLGAGVRAAVVGGLVSASVTSAFIAHAIERGLNVRSYRLAPGQQVACTAAPDDDFVVIRLRLDVEQPTAVDVAVEWTALADGATERDELHDLVFDRETGELVLLSAGERIRQVPRSRWQMRASVLDAGGRREVGPYLLDHTPWDELGAPG